MSPRTAHVRTATRRRLTSPLVVASTAAATLVLTLAVVAWGTLPRVDTTSPETGTRDQRVKLVVSLDNARRLGAEDVTLRVDGRRVRGVAVNDGQIVATTQRLDEGKHQVQLRTAPIGLLRRRVEERWTFAVDTTRPDVDVVTPEPGRARSDVRNTRFRLRTEPHAAVKYVVGPRRFEDAADEDGRVASFVRLGEGRNRVRVAVSDEVGNVTRRSVIVRVDSIPPILGLVAPAITSARDFDFGATAADASGVRLQVMVDGSSEGVHVKRSGPSGFQIRGEDELAEGRHHFVLVATDGFGHKRTVRRNVVVDSSEQLGENGLMPGARGRDIRQLHGELRKLKLFKLTGGDARREWKQRVYGRETSAAVAGFQRRKGLEADGVAGEETLATMTLKIIVNRATHSLQLLRLGDVIHTFPVAVGSAEYPTPTGSFKIQSMQENPTWTPPDSDWAKDAKVIPPGPNNPLGTRWMAINGTVGIHGTNNPASLGYSVSHGCNRMSIPDVEELFELVQVGTPVVVV